MKPSCLFVAIAVALAFPAEGRDSGAASQTDAVVDPGMEGLGIIDSDEEEEILEILKENRDEAENAEPEDLTYEAEHEEWMEAYDDLCALYEDALGQGKGLLLTF